ncbi:mucin-binding protein, partial [Ligilactobacillus araffinosus]|uniref:mucin-binding protein n=1 Tax=Ligilactobacillus araffinosus TaxID=147809 RepID=UPI003B833713
TYTANKEHAVVNYVDDATGKVVASETVDGTFGGTTTYDPTSEENKLKGEGYTIGSSDLPSNDQIKFTQDGQVPTYTVHLNEGTTTITPDNNPDNLDLT